MATLLVQLEQAGVFAQVEGVLLGTFTHYEESGLTLTVYDLLKRHITNRLPVVKTVEIGHGSDSKAIMIGEKMKFAKG